MTQAYNLSQLANKVNTSGQLDASTGLSGTTPIANGGTGGSTQQTALNNIAGAVTNGYALIGNGTNVSMQPITASGITGTLGTANGGTGQTTYTNGQLLIGNSTGNTLTKSTLTAGGGVTITNGAGSITIAATSNIGGATETTTSSDVTLTSSSNRVQKVTQTGTGKAFNLPDATTFSQAGSPIFNLGAITTNPMFIKYSDGYRASSVTSISGAQISLSNITNAQTGYAINDTYPSTKVTDESVAISTSFGNNSSGDGASKYIAIDQIDTNKFIVGYINVSTNTPYVVVATQSGNTFSFGTPLSLGTSDTNYFINVVGLSTTTAFAIYGNSGGNTQAFCLTISGTTITTSTSANIQTSVGPIYRINKLTSTTALFCYATSTGGTANIQWRVGTHNGASAPSFGATVNANTSSIGQSPAFICMLSSTKFLCIYNKGKVMYASCGTISGTTITIGTELTVYTSPNNFTLKGVLSYSATEAFFISSDFTGYLTISGTTITLGSVSSTVLTITNALVSTSATTGSILMNDSNVLTYSGSGSFTFKQTPTYTGQNYSTGLGNVISGSTTSYINCGSQYATNYGAIWLTAQVA
jgi:hypothetical protein